MVESDKNTLIVLQEHLESISNELEALEKRKAKLLKDKENAEAAIILIRPKRRRPLRYNKNSTFKQKVTYCLNREKKILSANAMLQMLFEVDPDLKEDEKNTDNSLRLAIFRLEREKELIRHKEDDMKAINYALKDWVDENGDIEDEYMP